MKTKYIILLILLIPLALALPNQTQVCEAFNITLGTECDNYWYNMTTNVTVIVNQTNITIIENVTISYNSSVLYNKTEVYNKDEIINKLEGYIPRSEFDNHKSNHHVLSQDDSKAIEELSAKVNQFEESLPMGWIIIIIVLGILIAILFYLVLAGGKYG